MDEESRESLELAARQGNLVNSMVNSAGWEDVVRPALDVRKKALLGQFCSSETYEQFVSVQQAVNAIDNLIGFVEVMLIEGKNALSELRDAEHP